MIQNKIHEKAKNKIITNDKIYGINNEEPRGSFYHVLRESIST